jgi:hypothetical protein
VLFLPETAIHRPLSWLTRRGTAHRAADQRTARA